jgi:predicted GNAT family acetyltransferase
MDDVTNIQNEFPDEAGYPDGSGFLDENKSNVLHPAQADPDRPTGGTPFFLVRDDARSQYGGIVGDEQIGSISFELFDTRIALLHTEVDAPYRHQGIASELIWRVLDDISSRGESVTVICPLVHAFVEEHPHFSALIDSTHPGL